MLRETKEKAQIELLQSTLDRLILRTPLFGPQHGHCIAHSIQRTSDDVLRVDHGSLYPALQRLERRGWITSTWGTSENNHRAKYYRLTKDSRKQLIAESSKWERLTAAIVRNMRSGREEC